MKIPDGEKVYCAADLFEYDETKKLNLREFFSRYKDQFPMLIVIIGGHYGETKYDCFDNFQVLRINCYSAQPRVIAEDPRLNPRRQKGFITIPEDTSIKYRLIKGHTKLGNPQPLRQLLEENERLPLLVQIACESQYTLRVGNSTQSARDFGHIMIKEKYMEHFFLMNAVDGVALKMNKFICMACLCGELDATPVTGFKYGSKEEFDEFFQKLSKEVAENGQVYDRTKGSVDYSEYSFDEMRKLIEISDYSSGLLTDGTEVDESDDDGDYEDVPPELPSRNPSLPPRAKIKTKSSKPNETNKQKSQSATSPKSPKLQSKHPKGAFGFLKRKHRDEKENVKEQEGKPIKEATKPSVTPKPSITPKPVNPKMQAHDLKSAPKVQPKETIIQAVVPERKKIHNDTNVDTKTGYVTLTSPRTYINTQIGRATVKPMPKAVESEDDSYLPIQNADTNDEEDYETLDIIPKHQQKNVSSMTARGKPNPLVAELQKKIALESTKIVEEEDDQGDYEVIENFDNEGYMVPIQNLQHSSGGQYQKESDSNVCHNYANDIQTLTIDDVSASLKALNLDKYSEDFKDNRIDGEILVSLSIEDLTNELGLKKLEAIRLHKFAKTGHIPK